MINKEYMLHMNNNVGFSQYDIIFIREVVDLGDTYNLITSTGDIFLDKDYCNISEDIITYEDNTLEIYLEAV